MSRPKKKRTKRYTPRTVMADPRILAATLPEITEKERTDLALAALLPLQNIKAGDGTMRNIGDVLQALMSGFCLAEEYDEKWPLKLLIQLGYCAATVIGNDLDQGKKTEPWMFEPVEAALRAIADMDANADRLSLAKAIQRTVRERNDLCRFDFRALYALDPTAKDTPEEVAETREKLEGKEGGIYLDEGVAAGFLFWHTRERAWFWADTQEGEAIRLTHPTVILLANRDAPREFSTEIVQAYMQQAA